MEDYKEMTVEEELDALERVVLDPIAKPIALSYQILRRITGDFSDVIGRGGSSVVYKGVLPNGLCIAVKRLVRTYELNSGAFINEITTTMKAKHKNVVRLIGYCSESVGQLVDFNGRYVLAEIERKCICMEYVPAGTLEDFIADESRGLELDHRYQIMKGICEVLLYLHKDKGIIHLDLKPSNILLDNNGMPKLFDFGLSRCFDEDVTRIFTQTIAGTRGYVAPESIDRGELSVKSDMYSFGVLVRKLFFGLDYLNYDLEEIHPVWSERLKGNPSLDHFCAEIREEIGSKCMEINPDSRPTALDIIQRLDVTRTNNLELFSSGHTPPAQQEPHTTDLVTPLHEKLSCLDFLKKITDGFSEELEIGTGGAAGFVYKGTLPEEGRVIAVKRIGALPIPQENFAGGTELLMRLDHENIVSLIGRCHDASNTHKVLKKGEKIRLSTAPEQLLCYEYMPNGSLRDYLAAGKGSHRVDWQTRYKMIMGTCQGLHYLHEGCADSPIAHLNLSLSNVLLDENKAPRIADVGLSGLFGEKDNKTMVHTMQRPIGYMAPEYFRSQGGRMKFPTKADIYSLGIIVLEIITGQENSKGELIKTVKENWTKESHIQSEYPLLKDADVLGQVKLCIDIGLQCANLDHHKRPTAGDIIRWLNQGHKSVPGASLPVSTTKDIHADNHKRGKEESSNTTAAAPVTEMKPGFWNKYGRKK